MELPYNERLDIASLSSVFSKITNSYKYYWFLSILDSLKDNNSPVLLKKDLALRMVANVWYPLDYFKLSFGKSDGFKKIADYISDKMLVDHSVKSLDLFSQINSRLTGRELDVVNEMVEEKLRYVPYLFVRPFLKDQVTAGDDNWIRRQIIDASARLYLSEQERVMYKFNDDSIEVSNRWYDYLQTHQGVLRGFIYWHLLKFLQKNNPTVVGLPDKIFKRTDRNFSLVKPFWNLYHEANPDIECIYSGVLITKKNMSFDHFLPWSYVVHDQVWNIIPTPKNVNSTKSNMLPSKEYYFEGYAKLQHNAFSFHADQGNNKLLEEYAILFGKSINYIHEQPFAYFRDELDRTFSLQLQTARNLGFTYPFIYRST